MLKNLLNGYCTQKEILSWYNANLSCKVLPKGIYGLVFNYKGIYNIVINKNLSQYKRCKTLIHELAQIELDHLVQYNKDLVAFFIQDYEDETNDYVKEKLKGKDENE